jgi:hypothetical protein
MLKSEIESGIERLERGFMVPEIWEDAMLLVETNCGTEHVPDEFGDPADQWNDQEERYTREFEAQLIDRCEGREVYSVERVSGWFCRLSAPGYMDCTDTNGPFESEELAAEYLVETYGDDMPDDDDE